MVRSSTCGRNLQTGKNTQKKGAQVDRQAIDAIEGASMSALIIRIPEEKRTRLKLVAKSRKVSVTKLIEEMATILLADFDAETRFELRAARGPKQN
jgi:hypothetical protein